jgi:hypothetical protein
VIFQFYDIVAFNAAYSQARNKKSTSTSTRRMQGVWQAAVVMIPAQTRPWIPMGMTGSRRKRGERRKRRKKRKGPTYVSWIPSCSLLSANIDNGKKANLKMKSPRM